MQSQNAIDIPDKKIQAVDAILIKIKNTKHREFVRHYCDPANKYNASLAFALANDKDPVKDADTNRVLACVMLNRPNIRKAVMDVNRVILDTDMLTSSMIANLDLMINGDFSRYFSVESLDEIPEHLRFMINNVREIVNKDGETVRYKISFMSKEKAYELLAKIMGLFQDNNVNVNVGGNVSEYVSSLDNKYGGVDNGVIDVEDSSDGS